MATETDQEKTEQPTARRLEKAREDGQVPRSRELSMVIIMLAVAVMGVSLGGYMIENLASLLSQSLQLERDLIMQTKQLPSQFMQQLVDGLIALWPLWVITILLAGLSPALIGGWLFSIKAFTPKVDKLNPLNGFKRMFGMTALMELIKALAKFILVAGTGYLVVSGQFEFIMSLGQGALNSSLPAAGDLLAKSFLLMCLGLVVIAAIDVPYQIYSHTKKMRMTVQEVKDEMKDIEGRPEVKAQVRQRQREIAMGRMLEDVAQADVVITNPQHFAVAMVYDHSSEGAPILLAKGQNEMAARIRELADDHQIKVLQIPLLARALYFTTDIGSAIPEGLYVAVAQVLAYIYQLNAYTSGNTWPSEPDLSGIIPSELHFNEKGERINAQDYPD